MSSHQARSDHPRSETVGSSPLPGSPESVFLAWLVWLPPGRELRAAAREELARIDRHPTPLPASVERLRMMFTALLAHDTLPDCLSLTERSS